MHMCLDGEGSLVVASQDVEGHSGDEVNLRVERDIVRTLALTFVCDSAIERLGRSFLAAIDSDVELEVDAQGQADHVEARANVGTRAGGSDYETVHLDEGR